MAEFDEIYAFTQRYSGVYCSVGVHPNDSGKQEIISAKELIDKTSYPKVIGIGETGLDYHYETSNRSLQTQSFLEHIEAARVSGLPVIIHTRDADDDTVNLLTQEIKKGPFKGLIHCFTSSQYLAEKVIELGFYISVSGIITFKNAEPIRQAIKKVPMERLLVETDAPYLAPIPFRGKSNEPSYVKYTNKMLADIKSISEEECALATTANFFRLFDKVKPA
jgi:TatD DNase family protein